MDTQHALDNIEKRIKGAKDLQASLKKYKGELEASKKSPLIREEKVTTISGLEEQLENYIKLTTSIKEEINKYQTDIQRWKKKADDTQESINISQSAARNLQDDKKMPPKARERELNFNKVKTELIEKDLQKCEKDIKEAENEASKKIEEFQTQITKLETPLAIAAQAAKDTLSQRRTNAVTEKIWKLIDGFLKLIGKLNKNESSTLGVKGKRIANNINQYFTQPNIEYYEEKNDEKNPPHSSPKK